MQRRSIGARLREARIAAGLSGAEVARMVGVQPASISRYETGERSMSAEVMSKYLDAVDADDTLRVQLDRTLTQVDDALWVTWMQGSDRDRSAAALADAQERATRIVYAAPTMVPGLLQTSDYARAIMRSVGVSDATDMRRYTLERLGRRELLEHREPPVSVEVYLTESVLIQNHGGESTMRGQLKLLLDLARSDTYTFRIIPSGAEENPLVEGSFTLIESPDDGRIVYQEVSTVSFFFNEKADVDKYASLLEAAGKVALSPSDSADLIARYMKEMERI